MHLSTLHLRDYASLDLELLQSRLAATFYGRIVIDIFDDLHEYNDYFTIVVNTGYSSIN